MAPPGALVGGGGGGVVTKITSVDLLLPSCVALGYAGVSVLPAFPHTWSSSFCPASFGLGILCMAWHSLEARGMWKQEPGLQGPSEMGLSGTEGCYCWTQRSCFVLGLMSVEASAAMAGVRPPAPRGAPNVSFHVHCGPARWPIMGLSTWGRGASRESHEGANAVLGKLMSAVQCTPLSTAFVTSRGGLGHSDDGIRAAIYCTVPCHAFRGFPAPNPVLATVTPGDTSHWRTYPMPNQYSELKHRY